MLRDAETTVECLGHCVWHDVQQSGLLVDGDLLCSMFSLDIPGFGRGIEASWHWPDFGMIEIVGRPKR